MIATLEQLKNEVEQIWCDISDHCKNCKDPDCVGYIWVLPEEENSLLEIGLPIIQINGDNGPLFLDSYERDSEGCLIVDKPKMQCPYLSVERKCSIRDRRPLTCHLYPLGLETEQDGSIVWALHTDCAHVRHVQETIGISTLAAQILEMLGRLAPELERKITDTFAKSDFIAKFEDGFNNYITIKNALI